MFFAKCLLLLFVLNEIDCARNDGSRTSGGCVKPRLLYGIARPQRRSKVVKFTCFVGYDLVGSKYATCQNGVWDQPLPVCVRGGCMPIQRPDNGLQWKLHNGAWIITFCLPGYSLQGSSTIYCDGLNWNATAPVCVADSKALNSLSCDFEQPDICEWAQDDLHDFDWKRQNRNTPSYLLRTGPSYDHTFGSGGNGYYMYIESTSKIPNDTARLLSPIFNSSLAKDGCFSFFYHMYGSSIGGLKIYQKPDGTTLQSILRLPASKQNRYVLFEKWGNQGDTWFTGVASLKDFNDDFQIVIEGISGSSYTSDIAIDDVAILQGENCTAAMINAVTPSEPESDSCEGRCDVWTTTTQRRSTGCHCMIDCLAYEDCCPDFFETCLYESTTAEDVPQTEKLVASTLSRISSSTTPDSTFSTTTISRNTITKNRRVQPHSETPRKSVIPTSSAVKMPHSKSPTTMLKTSTTKTAPAAKKSQTITIRPTTKRSPKTIPPKTPPKLIFESSTIKYNATGRLKKDNSTKRPVFSPTTKSSRIKNISSSTIALTARRVVVTTAKPTQRTTIKIVRKSFAEANVESRGLRTGMIVTTSLILLAGLAWLVFWARGPNGRASIARLRGRTIRDPEVRFLTAHADEDAE